MNDSKLSESVPTPDILAFGPLFMEGLYEGLQEEEVHRRGGNCETSRENISISLFISTCK